MEYTIKDYLSDKLLTREQLFKECEKLLKYGKKCSENKNSFVGNKILYHFNLLNLMKCRRNGKYPSFYDLITKEEHKDLLKKHIEDTKKRNRTGTMTNRIFEAWRINKGSIVFFKSAQAIYLYKKCGAKNILDFTMGWGGRLLGAWAIGSNYTGIDTNIEMMKPYEEMIDLLKEYDLSIGRKTPNIKIFWKSCLDVDYSKLEYDCVLTSPPYVNMELYEHMPLFSNDRIFYNDFLQNVYNKIKRDGITFYLNISPKMWEDWGKYCEDKPTSKEEINLKQQLGKNNKKRTKVKDMIYIL